MFTGTNLVLTTDKDKAKPAKAKPYESYWFEYAADAESEAYDKTEALKINGKEVRQTVQLDGKPWSGTRPKAVKYEDLVAGMSNEQVDAYFKSLYEDAVAHLAQRFPDEHPTYTVLRFLTKASEQDLRAGLVGKKPLDMSAARQIMIDSLLRVEGGFFDGSKILKTRDEIVEYVNRTMPDKPADETEEQAA